MAGEEDEVHGHVGEAQEEEPMIYAALFSSITVVIIAIVGALPS